MNKKYILFSFIAIVSSFIFSLFQFTFNADISLIALPLSTLFTTWFFYTSYVHLYKNLHQKKILTVTKLLQYLPYVLLASFVFRRAGEFGTAHWYDILTVLLWIIVLISSRGALYFLNPKRIFEKNPELKKDTKNTLFSKRSIAHKVAYETIDWIDSFVQVICAFLLFNIFILQLYQIPSESMVSEFLIGDRVIGIKLNAGPKFPLSEVGIPEITQYERGDIVIFSNPHYSNDRQSQIKTFVSQLVSMLTLTMVNLNLDEEGNIKADPLVKRVVAKEGEQLVMQDGILYVRTKENPTFSPISDDATWAKWNVASLPQEILKKVDYIPLSATEYDILLQIEQERKSLDIQSARQEAESLVQRFTNLSQQSSSRQNSVHKDSFSDNNTLQVYSFLSQSDTIIRTLYHSEGGFEWFNSFMTDWISHVSPNDFNTYIGGDMYTDAMFRQNLMLKLSFGRLAVRTAELLHQGISSNIQNQDRERLLYLQQAQNLAFYILTINNMRNMEVFPPNDENGNAQYISKDNFFVMGDNRFNSLDMRHSYDYKRKKITDYDPWSLYYDSNVFPQQISTDSILGTPVFRFFPFNRIGIPGGR